MSVYPISIIYLNEREWGQMGVIMNASVLGCSIEAPAASE